MSSNQVTSLVCVFHHQDHARLALADLQRAGVSPSAIDSISGPDAPAQIASFGMPDHERTMLEEKLSAGAVLLKVDASPDQVNAVERIFGDHSAKLVDEFDINDTTQEPVLDTATAGQAIPIIEEELVVGKRTVDQGGVRVFRRVVEIPVSESVQLREEHVVVDRHAVDRPATEADLNSSGRTLELTETAEEAVISKTAHVVEEVVIGKHSSDRVQHIEDTVRHTEIDVDELPAGTTSTSEPRLN